MKKVWTVESGEYSDYSVDVVCATEAAAQAWVKAMGQVSSTLYEIVERDLFEDADVPDMRPRRMNGAGWISADTGPRFTGPHIRWPADPTTEIEAWRGEIIVRAYAETREQAEKVCQDTAYRLKAELEGLT